MCLGTFLWIFSLLLSDNFIRLILSTRKVAKDKKRRFRNILYKTDQLHKMPWVSCFLHFTFIHGINLSKNVFDF